MISKDIQLKLRPMQRQDLTAVMLIEQRAYPFPWTEGIMQDCLRVGYCSWVVSVADDLVGYCIMSVAAGEAHILNICIDPDWQCKGLGRRMMGQMIRLATERDTDTLFLEVRASNRQAIALYESLGFNEIHVRRDYYPVAKGKEDALVFALPFV